MNKAYRLAAYTYRSFDTSDNFKRVVSSWALGNIFMLSGYFLVPHWHHSQAPTSKVTHNLNQAKDAFVFNYTFAQTNGCIVNAVVHIRAWIRHLWQQDSTRQHIRELRQTRSSLLLPSCSLTPDQVTSPYLAPHCLAVHLADVLCWFLRMCTRDAPKWRRIHEAAIMHRQMSC